MTRQVVERKTDKQLYKVIQGLILDVEEGRKKGVDASFVTLQDMSTGEQVLYAYPYWAEPAYTVVGVVEEEETSPVNAPGLAIPNELVEQAQTLAGEQNSAISSYGAMEPLGPDSLKGES